MLALAFKKCYNMFNKFKKITVIITKHRYFFIFHEKTRSILVLKSKNMKRREYDVIQKTI